ncbi:MAG TPA: ribosome maturation factor RimM, partial [Actinomycetota bacterium]|nr:ribosome maturation factor RimM [Actinomycetota bacterium]
KFSGVDSREDAEAMRGSLFVHKEQRRELDASEAWIDDLIGCEVRTLDGVSVGRVTQVIPSPAQDLLSVATEAGERFVPMVKEIVVSIDVAAKTVTVDPPEGLLG